MPDDAPADKISYEEPPQKDAPPIDDIETEELRQRAIKKLEANQVTHQVKAEQGITEPISVTESIPKEIPNMFFKLGSKVLQCEKFRTDDEENKLIAKHLSIIIGAQNSKIWSLIVILIVIVSKVTDCYDAVKRIFKKEPKVEPPPPPPAATMG